MDGHWRFCNRCNRNGLSKEEAHESTIRVFVPGESGGWMRRPREFLIMILCGECVSLCGRPIGQFLASGRTFIMFSKSDARTAKRRRIIVCFRGRHWDTTSLSEAQKPITTGEDSRSIVDLAHKPRIIAAGAS